MCITAYTSETDDTTSGFDWLYVTYSNIYIKPERSLQLKMNSTVTKEEYFIYQN